ncbi:MAG: hypothetical protein MHPSP_001331, partial [Paramarteilia canceri]
DQVLDKFVSPVKNVQFSQNSVVSMSMGSKLLTLRKSLSDSGNFELFTQHQVPSLVSAISYCPFE